MLCRDVLLHTFSYLPKYENAILRQVCREFQEIVPKPYVIPYAMSLISTSRFSWALNNGLNIEKLNFQKVIDSDIRVVKLFLNLFPDKNLFFMNIVESGNLDLVRAMTDGRLGKFSLFNGLCSRAVAENHITILRVLRDGSLGEKCPWGKIACRHIAKLEEYLEIMDLIESGELD